MESSKSVSHSVFSSLYESRRSFLCFYAMGFVGSFHEAEDIVHSVFEKILSKTLQLEEKAWNSYLMTAVRNSCLNHLSHRKTHEKYATRILDETSDSAHEDESFVNSRIETEILWEIFSKVEQLPDGCRLVFKMSYLENLSNQEIADILGISINTVKSQKARSKKLLRASLKDLFCLAAILLGF